MPPKKHKPVPAQADDEGQPSKKPRRLARKRRLKEGQTPILRLPIELRIMIYKFALPEFDDKGSFIIKYKYFGSGAPTQAFFQKWTLPESVVSFMKSMFSVNKQLSAEALDFFYSHRFDFNNIFVLQTFLLRGPPRALAQIRHLHLAWWRKVYQYEDSIRASTFALFDRLKSLQTYQIPSGTLQSYPGKQLRTWPTETPAHFLGKMLAAVLFRYSYPFLGPLVDNGGIEKLAEVLRIPVEAFVWDKKSLMEGLEVKEDDFPEKREAKDAEYAERVNEARTTTLKMIVKLHRNPEFRDDLLSPMPGCYRPRAR